jgi:hypothetical protein
MQLWNGWERDGVAPGKVRGVTRHGSLKKGEESIGIPSLLSAIVCGLSL